MWSGAAGPRRGEDDKAGDTFPFHRQQGSRGEKGEMAAGKHGNRGERVAGENTQFSRGKKAQKEGEESREAGEKAGWKGGRRMKGFHRNFVGKVKERFARKGTWPWGKGASMKLTELSPKL